MPNATEAQHTPGPWEVSEPYQHGDLYIEHTSRDEPVTFTLAHLARAFNGPQSLGVHQANARLIAAAPDMLEALRRIASEPCDHGPGFCPRDHAKAALAAIGVAL